MCLSNFKVYKNSLFCDDDRIVCYKLVKINNKKRGTKYITPYRNSNIYLGKNNISDRKGSRISPYERDYNTINKGIHVFTRFNTAKLFCNTKDKRIIVVICEKKDYVAHNYTQAVFTKVFYPRGQ